MNIKILGKSDIKMEFVLENSNTAFANALRRVMTNNVPVMSIEFVDFEENSSGLFDEVLTHRLGLIPMTFDKTVYNKKDVCKCSGKGCSRCEVVFVLEKQGPSIVKASDLKSTAEDVKSADPEIPIVELLDGQSLKLEATAQLGTGNQHVKWQAAIVGYRPMPSVKIYSEKCDQCGECIKACSKNIFHKKGDRIGLSNTTDCNLCMRCIEACEKNAAYVSADENNFIFTVESVSGLKPLEILESALDVLESDASDLIDSIKKVVK